jgi:hypothetical protein
MKTNLILMFDNGGQIDNWTIRASTEFVATVTPTRDYEDCFIALVFFDQGYLEGRTNQPEASVQFERIKNLVGGRENRVKVNFQYVEFGEKRIGFFPLFFTRGVEIRSDQAALIGRFFHKMEESTHDRIVENFLSKGADKTLPPQPYLKFPPLFDDPASLEKAPDKITVSFMVAEDGRVESLQFEDKVPSDVSTVIRQTLTAWKFLPRLKEGRAARAMVKVPLILREPAS